MEQPVPITNRAELRRWLERYEIRPSRRLGQNFLVDGAWADRIVTAVDPGPDDVVIEVGPGLGALTERLVSRAGRMVAIEVDHRLAAALRERLGGCANLEIIEQDVLAVDLAGIATRPDEPGGGPAAGGRVKLVSNLPYAITSPFLGHWLASSLAWERAVLMLQAEVVERITAGPGSKDYGALTLFVQYHAEVERLGTVPASAFWPQPEVDSAVIRLWPRAKPPVAVADPQRFFALIRAAFGRRRKGLPNALSAFPGVSPETARRACAQAGLDPSLRPENLTLDDFARLANLLFSSGGT